MTLENSLDCSVGKRYKIAYLVLHPIQYQAPLLKYINSQPDFDLTVFFRSDHSHRRFLRRRIGKTIRWDVSSSDGYRHEFLPAIGRTDLWVN